MIQNFAFWIEHHAANGKNIHDGKVWTYNSVRAFAEIFPYWTGKQVKRIIDSLVKQDVLITGNFNDTKYDRTTWYAFTDAFIQRGFIHLPKWDNGITQTGQPIPDNNINNNTDSIYIDGGEKNLFGEVEPKKERKRKDTSENLCKFVNSKFYDIDLFCKEFDKPEFNGIDIVYYYHSLADWASSKGVRRNDWISTARNFIRSDMEKGKLHKTTVLGGLTQEQIDYLKMLDE